VWLFEIWDGWKTPLILVRPETVIRGHRQGFKRYWRWRSRPKRLGRPAIAREHIEFIMRMSRDNPSWGEDKINEELRVKFGIRHSTSTIRKYMARRRLRRDGQKWRTFIKNHSHELFACDFMSQATHAIPDPDPELLNEPHPSGQLIALPVLGGLKHDYRLAA
jgi:putative transposase